MDRLYFGRRNCMPSSLTRGTRSFPPIFLSQCFNSLLTNAAHFPDFILVIERSDSREE
jgi:hypothetical protein